MYKPGCEYCVTVPDSQSEERLKQLAKSSVVSGLIGIGFMIAALFVSWQHQNVTLFSLQFLLPVSLVCEIVALILLFNSSKDELYLFEDTNGVEHLHTERPVRVGSNWHCNTPREGVINIQGYILAIKPNGWRNDTAYLLNRKDNAWKQILAYSAYHSDVIELRDYSDEGVRESVGEVLSIINSCGNWEEYKGQTFRLGVSVCLAILQAQSAKQTQPSPNAAAMRQTLTNSLIDFRDRKSVAKWEQAAKDIFKVRYHESPLPTEVMSPEPTQPPGIVA